MKTEKRVVDKVSIGLIIGGVVGILAGAGCGLFAIFGAGEVKANEVQFPEVGAKEKNGNAKQKLSVLTGEELAKGKTADGPIYCMQTPNGLDGARPQAGLTEAGVVFEAIAEAGITRFAAIYQEPDAGVIGPIRSLRTYYLEWDTPFDCTIVHSGGSGDALAALSSGNYRDLDENYETMYRGTYVSRGWNNLFTTGALLAKATAGETSSSAKGFARLTPEESAKERIESGAIEKLVITEPSEGDTSEVAAEVPEIAVKFSGDADFSVNYSYDIENNTYLRSYASGDPHLVYECDPSSSMENPEDVCNLVQVAPNVVVAMIVEEGLAADAYHEDIEAIGMGAAYIFQNGSIIEGTWSKSSAGDQIKFFDEDGNEVKLAVGQTFVEAVPEYGSVTY